MMQNYINTFLGIDASYIRSRLSELVKKLKLNGLWYYVERHVRDWIELALRLKTIKFRSQAVLSILVNIIKKLQLLLSPVKLLSRIGTLIAWRNSRLASRWGNNDAEEWRRDPTYIFYCGLTSLQAARVTLRRILVEEMEDFKNIIEDARFNDYLKRLSKTI
ncbi:MAG: hypothetical protein QXP57_07150 [Nitrososphaerota archaeon]